MSVSVCEVCVYGLVGVYLNRHVVNRITSKKRFSPFTIYAPHMGLRSLGMAENSSNC